MILIVSHPGDDHAAAVLGVTGNAGHPAAVIDTARFPTELAIRSEFTPDGTRWWVRDGADDIWFDLGQAAAGWWRRPMPYLLDDALDPQTGQWAYQECHEAIAGMFAGVPATWINDPDLDERAAHKPYQLAVARRLGIPIPPTLITNDPYWVAEFVEANGAGNTIYKTFRATEQHWRETRVFGDAELAHIDAVRFAPSIFQRRVDSVADLRVIVIGERTFATEISRGSDVDDVDYRLRMDSSAFTPVELPARWEDSLHDLLGELGLVYGAVDLMRTVDGDLVFLEINPSGEWLYVEERTGEPITAAVAGELMRIDNNGAHGNGGHGHAGHGHGH